jgi:hypothetical protein
MRVYVANFGVGNWAWPECLRKSSIAVMDDDRVHVFWKNGDRLGYIAEAKKVLKLSTGHPATAQVSSRWFNLNTIFHQTNGDIWVHRAQDKIWWTISQDSIPEVELRQDPRPIHGSERIYLYYKQSSAWSDRNRKGVPLSWNGLHAKGKELLTLHGTFHSLSADHANYIRALIDGDSLLKWHDRKDWSSKADRSKRGP